MSDPGTVQAHRARDLEASGVLEIAVESLPSGVVVIGADGRIVRVNRRIEEQFGYRREELLGRSVEKLLPAMRAISPHELAGSPAHPVQVRGVVARHKGGLEISVDIDLDVLAVSAAPFVVVSVRSVAAPDAQQEDASRRVVESRIEFERLVAELSVQFINLPPELVDDAIRDALRRVGEALELDRCTFFRVHPDGVLTDPVSWARPGIPANPAPVPASEQFPWALDCVRHGELVVFNTPDEIPNPIDRANYVAFGTKAAVTVPLSVGGRIIGAVGFNMVQRERAWEPETVHRLRVVASAFGSVLARRESDEALRKALADVERLRDQLHAENIYLKMEVRERRGPDAIIAHTPAMQRVLAQVDQVAATDSTVLLLGETGVGKELFATRIHELSARRGRPMVRVNCSAIPSTLIESELFGREKGAYTGALASQVGRFELANGSTIFLDEIGDLPPEVQVKLLRVLEERQIERLGSPKSISIDVRIIAATHRNLEGRIADGSFREDLFYRLNVFPIVVPPLRERIEDVPFLTARFVEEFSKSFGKRIESIPRENMAALQRYPWPGNIRELRNVIERAMILATGPRLTIALPTPAVTPKRLERLFDVEREHVRSVLESTGWRIRGPGGAADRLGVKPTTLETRMARLGLKRPAR
jgi:PAS domain S-box-containing protein